MTLTRRRIDPHVEELLCAAPQHKGHDAPAGYRVSRCVDCTLAYTWKGSAPRPACPACGGHLATTTRMLKAVPFIELAGELLTLAELEPNGLADAARAELLRADDLDARASQIDEKVAQGRLVAYEHNTLYWAETASGGRAGYSLIRKDAPTGLRDSASQHRAKAHRYARRAAKLENAPAARSLATR